MPNIITQYVKWVHNQGGVRGHGAGSGFAPFQTLPSFPASAGYQEQITLLAGDSLPDPGDPQATLYLAFCNVTHSADGSHIIFPGQGTQVVTLGSQDMIVTYLYVSLNGGGNGGPGVYIDAFDVNDGVFSNIVHIVDVSDPSLDNSANMIGFVPSTNPVHLEAVSNLGGLPFLQWTIEYGNPAPAIDASDPRGLSIGKNNVGVCFIFYFSQSTHVVVGPPNEPPIWHSASYAEMVDGDPHFPMGPEMGVMAAAMIMAGLSEKLAAAPRAAVLKALAKQVETTAAGMVTKLNGMAKEQ